MTAKYKGVMHNSQTTKQVSLAFEPHGQYIISHIYVRRCPQIAALKSITMDNWERVLKQARMAAWFERSHNTEAKLQFFIGSADAKLPTWNPNANPIESWHEQLKHLAARGCHAVLFHNHARVVHPHHLQGCEPHASCDELVAAAKLHTTRDGLGSPISPGDWPKHALHPRPINVQGGD